MTAKLVIDSSVQLKTQGVDNALQTVGRQTETPTPLSPQPSVPETIAWLLALNLPPLPVAPAQDPHLYPLLDKSGNVLYESDGVTPKRRFTGKNPSYLDENDKPHLVNHSLYRKRQPNAKELKLWFSNPKNGIGTLGSDNDRWLDFDTKNFKDADECKLAALAVATKIQELSGSTPTVEETQSGGWHVEVYTTEKADFTNFALTPGGKHVGEALGAGRFTVLAPTIGPSGNPYTTYCRHSPDAKPVVPTLEAIGIYPVRATKTKSAPTPTPTPTTSEPAPTPTPTPQPATGKVIDLALVGSDNTQDVLQGVKVKGDRSGSLTLAIRDLYGWENWLTDRQIAYTGSTASLIHAAGEKLGVEAERVDRILNGINPTDCTPSAQHEGGDEACTKKVKRLQRKASASASNGSGSGASANAKDKVVPMRSNLPKAVGGTNDNPPIPPTYGGGRGGFDPDDDEVDWKAPVPFRGHLGVWKQLKKDEPPEFDAKCDFDFVILQEFKRHVTEDGEPNDPDGGGLRILVTQAGVAESSKVNLNSQDYSTAKLFTAALKKGLGFGVRCRLSDYELQALIRSKIEAYRKQGGKQYILASYIGMQENGTWIFPKVRFSAHGKPLGDDENDWVFNANVSKTDKLPIPNIPPEQDPKVLKELIEAIKAVAGDNWKRWLLCLGWTAMQLNRYHIQHSNLPILSAYGNPGGGKTMMAKAALSVIWGNEEEKQTLRKTSESYLYEILSRLTVPFLWDDAKATNKEERKVIENSIIDIYGCLSRKVRGQDQTPKTSPIITSNPKLGDTLDAALSRMVSVFTPVGSIDYLALPRLRKAKKNAPKSFSAIIGIGYAEDDVNAIRDELLPYLPTAHERTPHHLSLLVYYTQKVLALAGVADDILPWVLNEFCPDINEEQSGVDALADFFERLSAAQASGGVGDWNVRRSQGRDGKTYLALYMPSVWSAITRGGNEPNSYNQKMLERLLKEKGAISGTVRLAKSKLLVDTWDVENIRGHDPSDLRTPPEVPRYCVKVPIEIVEAYLKPNELVMKPPENLITTPTPDKSSVSAPSTTPCNENCNESSKKLITTPKPDVASALASNSTTCNECNDVMSKVWGNSEKVSAEPDASEKSLAPADAQIENQICVASNPAPISPQNSLHSLQASPHDPETTTHQGVDVVMNFVMDSSCNEITNAYTEEKAEIPPEIALEAQALNSAVLACTSQEEASAVVARYSYEAKLVAHLYLSDDEHAYIDALLSDPLLEEESIRGITAALAQCPNAETLRHLSECWSSTALTAACKRLPSAHSAQINAWMQELSNA